MNRIAQFLEDRQSTLASGLAALLIIVVGFLVFNYLSGFNKTLAPQVSPEATKTAQVNTTKTPTPPTSTPQPASQPSTLSTSTTSLPQSYVVTSGDSLSQIAQKFYGNENKWTVIAAANHLANPNTIHSGNVLTIPKLDSTPAVSTSSSTSPTTAVSATPKVGSNYVVKTGDTLWDLAVQAYGSGYEWYRIDRANGPLPRNTNSKPVIVVGQVLKIP